MQETYHSSTSVLGAYTLLYIVYRGFLVYFCAFQGEGEHLRGTLEGDMYLFRAVRRMAGTLQVGMGGLLQTDDASDECDGVEV